MSVRSPPNRHGAYPCAHQYASYHYQKTQIFISNWRTTSWHHMPAVETETDYEVVVRVRDGNGGSTTATAEVTVEPEGDSTEGSDPSGVTDDSTSDSGTGETCSPASGERCNGPPRYLDADRYRAGACTMGPQGAREDCADQQYAHTGSQYMLVDNDGDHEITFDVGPATLLVGIIPQQSDVATIFVDSDRYEQVRENAWTAVWNESLSRRDAALIQGERYFTVSE